MRLVRPITGARLRFATRAIATSVAAAGALAAGHAANAEASPVPPANATQTPMPFTIPGLPVPIEDASSQEPKENPLQLDLPYPGTFQSLNRSSHCKPE